MRQRKPMKRLVEGLLCQQTALHLKFKDQDRQLDALQIHAVPPAAPAVLAAMVLAVEGHLEVVRALLHAAAALDAMPTVSARGY